MTNQPARAPAPTVAAPSVDLLIYFTAVAEHASFTRAARELGIDQSWLSHKIRQLEADLGYPLFVRSTRHVELTIQGTTLLEPCRRLVQAANDARQAAALLKHQVTGSLRIGGLPYSFDDTVRVDLVDRFLADHSDVAVDVQTGPTPVLIEMVRSGAADCAFVSWPFDLAGLECLLLRSDPFYLMVPKEDSLANKAILAPEDLAGRRLVVPQEKFTPAAFEIYYRPYLDAGAVAVPLPEFQGATAYAARWRLMVLCKPASVARMQSEGFVCHRLGLEAEPCRKYLVRPAGLRSPSLDRFWALAERYALSACEDLALS